MKHVTEILHAAQSGDKQAAAELLPLVYDELRKLATARLAKESMPQSLNATALVHEAFLRLVGKEDQNRWDGRGHFFSAAAEAMRRILVETARRRSTEKHGAKHAFEPISRIDIPLQQPPEEVIAVHEALDALAQADMRAAELVKLRYFAGFTIPEIADILSISPRTADNVWAYAKAWLAVRLRN